MEYPFNVMQAMVVLGTTYVELQLTKDSLKAAETELERVSPLEEENKQLVEHISKHVAMKSEDTQKIMELEAAVEGHKKEIRTLKRRKSSW